jgi:hypothetical protein
VAALRLRAGDGSTYFAGPDFADEIISALRQYIGVLASYDAGWPVYAFLSLCNARGSHLRYSASGIGYNDAGPLGREVIALPEVLIGDASVNLLSVMRPVFNTLWNAFGFAKCDMYGSQGQWVGTA